MWFTREQTSMSPTLLERDQLELLAEHIDGIDASGIHFGDAVFNDDESNRPVIDAHIKQYCC